MSTDKEQVNEVSLNLLGGLFLGAVGAWLAGRFVGIKFRGTKDEINAVANAMLSSKRFQDELKRPGASIQSVVDKLRLKNASAAEFERVLGVKWPL